MSYDKSEDLNELGAKLIKAELLGDEELAATLKGRLENARKSFEWKKTQLKPNTSKKKEEYSRENIDKVKNRRQNNEEAKMFKRNYKYDEYDDLNYDDFDGTSSKKLKTNSKFVHEKNDKSERDHKSAENCSLCFENTQKHLVISVGKQCYLSVPSSESLVEGMCMIVPVFHCHSSVICDEDVWQEIMNYKKALLEMFKKKQSECVFLETYSNENKYGHMVIECVPLPMHMSNLAPIYFKKAILESESEWSTNKKIIELKDKTIRKMLPKNIPYFAVLFGNENGFIHIIENSEVYPKKFAWEIIAGILNLDPLMCMRTRKETLSEQSKKVIEFSKWWMPFEFNKD